MTEQGSLDVLVVDDEPLLRGLVCDVLEEQLLRVRCVPAGSREEAARLLARGGFAQLVTEVRLHGANVSAWIAETAARHPHLSVITFSVESPWFPEAHRSSPLVTHVDKVGDGIAGLVDACRRSLGGAL